MRTYKCLQNNNFILNEFSIVPIRDSDRYKILKIRNEQLYHLRQQVPLTVEIQDAYFKTIVAGLFQEEKPAQLLFTFLRNGEFVGYGGLVHINWIDHHAEISFIMETELEAEHFHFYWKTFLSLIEKIAFKELKFHKIFTYAFDLRKHLYLVLEECGFKKEAVLSEHCYIDEKYLDVIIHTKYHE
jgi:RimJ/RimL family protein N-acetyltransferase